MLRYSLENWLKEAQNLEQLNAALKELGITEQFHKE